MIYQPAPPRPRLLTPFGFACAAIFSVLTIGFATYIAWVFDALYHP